MTSVAPSASAAIAASRSSIRHVKTEKGHGWKPADGHPFRLYFSGPFDPQTGKARAGAASTGYQDVAASIIGEEMERDERIVAITPSTLYASGLGPVFRKFPGPRSCSARSTNWCTRSASATCRR